MKTFTIQQIAECLKEKVYKFDEHYRMEIDEESEEINLFPLVSYAGTYVGNIHWVAEVAIFFDKCMSVRFDVTKGLSISIH